MIEALDIYVARQHSHQIEHATRVRNGAQKHGIRARIFDNLSDVRARHVCCWGWRLGRQFRDRGLDVLVMERAYLGDRFRWTSLGWNGLNGRAVFPVIDDGGQRFELYHGETVRPWAQRRGYALIMGQCQQDQSLEALKPAGIMPWYREAALVMQESGYEVRFRQHPVEVSRRVPPPAGFEHAAGSLADALGGAALAVTYNSNSAVDAVLAGVPTIACDHGSMAWPVAAHGLNAQVQTPDRTAWATRLAYCQWLAHEIESGLALDYVLAALPTAAAAA